VYAVRRRPLLAELMLVHLVETRGQLQADAAAAEAVRHELLLRM
jgi:hypothetical protein